MSTHLVGGVKESSRESMANTSTVGRSFNDNNMGVLNLKITQSLQ